MISLLTESPDKDFERDGYSITHSYVSQDNGESKFTFTKPSREPTVEKIQTLLSYWRYYETSKSIFGLGYGLEWPATGKMHFKLEDLQIGGQGKPASTITMRGRTHTIVIASVGFLALSILAAGFLGAISQLFVPAEVALKIGGTSLGMAVLLLVIAKLLIRQWR